MKICQAMLTISVSKILQLTVTSGDKIRSLRQQEAHYLLMLDFAGVKHGFASNIKSVDTLLHGFDITYASDTYFYEGDGVRVNEVLESKYIHIDNCETSGFGDDGITTHHSRYLLITNNYSHHATG